MIDNTINDDKTIAGGGKDMILAGRGKPIRQLARGKQSGGGWEMGKGGIWRE